MPYDRISGPLDAGGRSGSRLPDPAVVVLCDRLLKRDELGTEFAQLVSREEPTYIEGLPIDDVAALSRQHLVAAVGMFVGRENDAAELARMAGQMRAEQGVPLPLVLRAYRRGGKFLLDQLTLLALDAASSRALLVDAPRIWSILDDLSEVMTAAYYEVQAERAASQARLREGAMTRLLDGGHYGSGMWELADILRLPRRGTYAVVVEVTEAITDRAASDIERALAGARAPSSWKLDADGRVGVVALGRHFPTRRLIELLEARAPGRTGVSAEYDALEHTPSALRQARLAAASATPGGREVVDYGQASIGVLVASERDVAADVMRTVMGRLLELPARDHQVLLETLRVWFAHGGSTAAAAKELCCHRNTVRHRLGRVASLTGRDLQSPVEAAELYVALEAHRQVGSTGGA